MVSKTKPVSSSRIVAAISHLNTVKSVEEIGDRGSQVAVKGTVYYGDMKDIEQKYGWKVAGFSSDGVGYFHKP